MSGSSSSAWKSGVVVSMPSTISSRQRPAQAGEREVAVAAVHDQLADQAVVVGRDGVAVEDRAVHPHAEAAGGVVGADAAGRGLEVRQLLGVDPALDRVPGGLELGLGEGHRQAGGDADLLLHEVDVVDRLGHRVLDLQAGVHLDEVELAVLVEELDGAGAGVVDAGDGVGADAADPRAGAGVDHRRGRLLEHLLVAALQRAVALAEVDGTALAVAEDLDLDVARGGEVLLEVDLVVAEGGLGLGAGGLERRLHFVGVARELHAAAAAAGGRLDDDRVAEGLGDLAGLVEGGDRTVGAGDAGHAERLHRLLGGDLVAHDADVLGGRADEGDAVVLDDLHEVRVLGEKAVARDGSPRRR